MALHDEIREQHTKLRDMSFREKVHYILYYYKFHIVAVLVIAVAGVSLAHTILTKQDTAFYAAAVNSSYYSGDVSPIMEDFLASSGIDPGEGAFILDTSLMIDMVRQDPGSFAGLSKLMALFQSSEVDVLMADAPVIDNYAEVGAFADLRKALPAELFKKAEEDGTLYFYTYEDTGETPVGVRISSCPAVRSYGLYPEDSDVVFTISNGAKHQEPAVRFLAFLLGAE